MRFRHILPFAVIAALLVGAPAASASYRVGIGDQNPAMFSSPAWQSLHLKRTRLIVSWDYAKDPYQANYVGGYMAAAAAAKQEVLVAFTAHSGCYVNGHYSKKKVCRAPSKTTYSRAVKAFIKAYPAVKYYEPWNEANHVSQPTHKSPKLAYRYYSALRSAAGHKRTVLAADVLDQSDVASYLRGFLRASHGKGRIWGLHNYKDVNRTQSKGVRAVLKTVPGQVWLTETGGIYTFLPSFKTSSSRPAKATTYMFKLARAWDSRKHGYRSKVTRLYVYRWFGEVPGARFDAGLVNADGTPRPALTAFEKGLKSSGAKR